MANSWDDLLAKVDSLANADKCPECGALYAMVGRRHLCRGVKPVEVVKPSSTYRSRDAEKRRLYMREFMRKKRSKHEEAKEA